MKYADLHCDYLSYFSVRERLDCKIGESEALEDFFAADCAVQCFALFCEGEGEEDRRKIARQLAFFQKVKPRFERDRTKAVLAVEGGGATCGDLTLLERLFSAGVKIFSPVWNIQNTMSAPCGESGGLTKTGRRAVAYALGRGVVPDISHASDEAAKEIFLLARERKKPVLATHVLSRSLYGHRRNLTDEQIRNVAQSGGLAGLCFVREFAGGATFAAHLKRFLKIGGEDCVAVGSDFFGCKNPLVAGAREMPNFFRSLEKEFTPRCIEKFAYANVRERLLPLIA